MLQPVFLEESQLKKNAVFKVAPQIVTTAKRLMKLELRFPDEELRSGRAISSSLETSVTRLKIGENFYFGLIFPSGLGGER